MPSREIPTSTAESLECFFIPPAGWDFTDPTTLSAHVKIAFLKKGKKELCPSINLAVEKTNVSLNEYLKAVKAIHEKNRKSQWRLLGKVRTAAGLAQLTEIDSSSEYGPLRILQLILIKQGYAYILTAAALKEEFSEYYRDFQSAFRSLTLTADLVSAIPQLDRRECLKKEQNTLLEKHSVSDEETFQKENWLPFQARIIDQFQDMGAYWQALILRSTRDTLQQDGE